MCRKLNSFRVGIDVDDVLGDCNSYAIKKLNEKKGTNFTIHDIEAWADSGPTKERMKFFSSEDFVTNQPVLSGAKQFIHDLMERGVEILLITAVPSNVVLARMNWIKKNFSEIPEKNIVLTARKDICDVDVLIDDAPHNIKESRAKYPILFRRPWNQNVSGLLSVNNYDDALNLIDSIIYSSGFVQTTVSPEIVCLVGPSGSGKTELVEALRKSGKFDVPVIFTTGSRKQDYYQKISKKEFITKEFAETTAYAGDYYGTTDEAIQQVLSRGLKMVIPIDIGGANSLRRKYGKKVLTVFVARPKDELVAHVLKKDITDACKVSRIVSLDYELRNEELCDISFAYVTDINDIVGKIISL